MGLGGIILGLQVRGELQKRMSFVKANPSVGEDHQQWLGCMVTLPNMNPQPLQTTNCLQ
jgi:hypothetical protein